METLLEIIKSRRSIRAFLKKPVSQKTLYTILETARYSPSGVNTQPWQVASITGNLIKTIGDDIITAREAGIPENPDYHYYPTQWSEPYKSRRKACGLALYSSINITLDEKEKRKAQWYKNYYFFDAPVGLFFFLDAELEKGSWIDMGMFIQNVMLSARALGLETCPQAAMAEYPDIVRKHLGFSKEKILLCGLSLGYAEYNHPVNQYRTERESVDSFTQFIGF